MSVKYERVYLRAYESVSGAKADTAQHFDWYNSERGHTSSENHHTPDAAYGRLLPKQKVAA